MNGQYYFIATDASDCTTDTVYFIVDFASAIEEENSVKKLVEITNVLGQVINFTNNVPLFYRYSDGTVEKRITLE